MDRRGSSRLDVHDAVAAEGRREIRWCERPSAWHLRSAHDLSEPRRRPIAQATLDELWRTRTGTTSTQVLSEFYVVATRKFDPPMSGRAAREVIGAYSAWPVVGVDAALILAASTLEERHTLSFWEALIIEAAARSGATRLVSEDLQAGRRIRNLTIENPFAHR